jgi:hypothetical protein
MAVNRSALIEADFLETGSGPLVMLVHSSVSGARQWRSLMADLRDSFHVRAVNLYGDGTTPPCSIDAFQSLDDQSRATSVACLEHGRPALQQ